jgi:hypothetical protein
MYRYSSHKALTIGVTEVDVEEVGSNSYYINLTSDEVGSDEYLLPEHVHIDYDRAKAAVLKEIARKKVSLLLQLLRLEEIEKKYNDKL